jgi:hypothetical protein
MKIKGSSRSRWQHSVRNCPTQGRKVAVEGSFILGYDTASLANWFQAVHRNNQDPQPHHRKSLKTQTAWEYNDEEPGENTDT